MAPRIPPCLSLTDIELPDEVAGLYDLAYNLWWTWTPEARKLFSAIDDEAWARYRNPVQMLINVEPPRWEKLLENEAFRASYSDVVQELEGYLRERETWFARTHPERAGDTIAYFSMEYGLEACLALYSGGLGVLSGDHSKAASDLGLPFAAVGLLYRHGYFRQSLDASGLQQHSYPEYDFTRLPLRPVASSRGRALTVAVPLPGREVHAQVWMAQVGRVPLFLLDTDLPENDPADRPITDILYVQGREMRLVQELVLGVGGVRALAALGIEPTVWHLNEGHCAFAQLQRLEDALGGPVPSAASGRFEEAVELLRPGTVFTTHTPVPAGNEQFDRALARRYLEPWAERLGTGAERLLELGEAALGESEQPLNLTALGIRTSSATNGVSRLNAEVLDRMWRDLFPEVPAGASAIEGITNGVHAATWLGPEVRRLLERHLGLGWQDLLAEPEAWSRLYEIPDDALWAAHQAQKERLGRFSRSRLREQLARHGGSPDDLREVAGFFDPEALTLGFARRFATYKRASLIFSDLERLRALVAEAPLQILFAGKAHPADGPGQELIRSIFQLSKTEELKGRVFFIEDYDMRVGAMLVQGVDVWLNTPRRPLEASGTSGQKAAMNGALNFSVLDGWWPEGYDGANGWVIGGEQAADDEAAQDREDAASFYRTLEDEVLTAFRDRDGEGLPRAWIARMKHAMASTIHPFSANRMVRDYAARAYVPAAGRAAALRERAVAAGVEA